jgi:hypothetical protein
MNSPPALQNWQSLAHGFPQGKKGFAAAVRAGDTVQTGTAAATRRLTCLNCYPSPIFWPDPRRIRPFFWAARWPLPMRFAADVTADVDDTHQSGFSEPRFVAIIEPIKTRTRGKNRCRSNHSFWWAWPLWPCPAACKTRLPVAWAGPLSARWPLMRWMKTFLPGQRLGRLAALPPAMFPARLAASRAIDVTAADRAALITGHPRFGAGGFSFWGEDAPCLTRS